MSEVKVPLVRPSMPMIEEFVLELSSIWDTRILTNMASKHRQLEGELKKYLKVDLFQLFVNGHIALECALQAMSLQGEVITTPFTFASTPHAIVRSGLTPVFCDIREDDYTMDADKIEALITERTVAILPVHVYGMACEVEKIQHIADKHHLKVIYDAAHAFGVEVNGSGIGSFGDASMFSFHATKAYNMIEGGGLSFRDEEMNSRLYILKNFGITGEDNVDCVAGNGKLDEFRAAMGLCNLRHYQEEVAKRRKASERYDEVLAGVKGIKILPKQEGVTKNYSYYPIVLNGYKHSRNELCENLIKKGILTRKYFYPLCNEYECYREQYGTAKVPVAQYISQNVLCLPMYAGLTQEQVDYVCEAILE